MRDCFWLSKDQFSRLAPLPASEAQSLARHWFAPSAVTTAGARPSALSSASAGFGPIRRANRRLRWLTSVKRRAWRRYRPA